MTGLDHVNYANTRYAFSLTSVTSSGFTVKCLTWGNSKMYHLYVSWVSLES